VCCLGPSVLREAGAMLSSEEQALNCPRCGSASVACILYGLVIPGIDLQRDLDAGRIVLGGCVVDSEDRECIKCDFRWDSGDPKALGSHLDP